MVRDSAGITIIEHDLAEPMPACAIDSVPAVSIGTDEGEPEYELHRVFGSTRLSDGRLVLVNQGTQELRYYDAGGRFLQQAGRAGQGPGEFTHAFLIWPMRADTVWVGDYDPWQFLVFGPDGKWVRTVRPAPPYLNSPEVIAVLGDGRTVLARDPPRSAAPEGFTLRELTLVVHGPDGALRDTIGTYPHGRWGQVVTGSSSLWLYPLFESFARVSAAGAYVVIGHGSSPELSVFETKETLRLTRLIRWTVGDRAVTKADIDADRKRYIELYADVDEQMRKRLVEPMISQDRPVAEHFPAFAGVEVGRDGRIWVREFRRPTANGAPGWLVFDAGGRFACRAITPELDEFHEFGADYLLGLDHDSLGVERVSMYLVGAPGSPRPSP